MKNLCFARTKGLCTPHSTLVRRYNSILKKNWCKDRSFDSSVTDNDLDGNCPLGCRNALPNFPYHHKFLLPDCIGGWCLKYFYPPQTMIDR